MPVDVFKGEYYKFDFDKLIEMPKDKYKSDRFNKYLNDWYSLLHRLDNISINEYNLFVYTFNRKCYCPEYYQFTQMYMEEHNPYIFNFFIEYILSNIKTLGLRKRYIGVKKLSKISSLDETIVLDGRTVKPDPIVICPFFLPNAKFVILDGNTRMNYYLKNNKIFISYIIYNITSKNDFLLSVDWAMYSFINEINAFIVSTMSSHSLHCRTVKPSMILLRADKILIS